MTCSRPQRNVHRPGSEIRCPNHCATPPPREKSWVGWRLFGGHELKLGPAGGSKDIVSSSAAEGGGGWSQNQMSDFSLG